MYEFSLNEGERIKAIRELEGLTQEELGKKVGLSAETISGIESQNFRPSNDLIVELSKALNISHVALIPGSISTQETSNPVSVREDSIYSLILIIRKLYSCVSEPEYNQDTFTDIHFVKNECLYHISGRDLHELIPLVDGLVSAFVEQKKVCDQQQDPA